MAERNHGDPPKQYSTLPVLTACAAMCQSDPHVLTLPECLTSSLQIFEMLSGQPKSSPSGVLNAADQVT